MENSESELNKVTHFLGDNPEISIFSGAISFLLTLIQSLTPVLSFLIVLCAAIVGVLTAWDKIEKRIIKQKIKNKSKKVTEN